LPGISIEPAALVKPDGRVVVTGDTDVDLEHAIDRSRMIDAGGDHLGPDTIAPGRGCDVHAADVHAVSQLAQVAARDAGDADELPVRGERSEDAVVSLDAMGQEPLASLIDILGERVPDVLRVGIRVAGQRQQTEAPPWGP